MDRITNITELVSVLPEIVKLYGKLTNKWNNDAPVEEFTKDLIANFSDQSYYYCRKAGEELQYFLAAFPEKGKSSVFCWLFYIHPRLKDFTHELLREAIEDTRRDGFEKIHFTTIRLTSSYKRWAAKIGAKPRAIIYEIDING